jgi:hypothetical protein
MSDDLDLEKSIEQKFIAGLGSGLLTWLTPEQCMKRLVLVNCVDVDVRVVLRYRSLSVERQWEWYPSDKTWSRWTVKAGESIKPRDKSGYKIYASRIRVIVIGSGFLNKKYRDDGLWLLKSTYISPIKLSYIHALLKPGQASPNDAYYLYVRMKEAF